jgi:S-adenosylmethionine:tRNA ribosyltransferase-isomerase
LTWSARDARVAAVESRDLDFHLPAELIAQTPTAERAASRLLHYRRSDHVIAHRRFSDLPGLLRRGDLLVFNDAQVVPARFALRKNTGGRIEGLFVRELSPGRWRVMLRNLGQFRGELHFEADPAVTVRVIGTAEAEYDVDVSSAEPAHRLLARLGRMPLPPYIKREKEHDERDDLDRERYQTVFAKSSGSIAAPTAGLHFTPALLAALEEAGVERTFVTLHVGLGTFKPIATDRLEDHAMHVESYTLSPASADAINRAKGDARRVIAVGTTAARVLESQPPGPLIATSDETGIFIYPPYEWKHVNAMITNFHLPRSTLIALVAAMVGLDEQRRIYAEAIAQRYRFFSYGDAMLVE